MRSRRYKRHRAAESVAAHKAGWKVYGGWYPMDFMYNGDFFYHIKHMEWWESINRYVYKFVTDYDAKNYIFSNMELCKHRKGKGEYPMCNNHYLLKKYYEVTEEIL